MKPSATRNSERGAVVVMVAVWLPVLALFASFALDFGHFFDYSRNLQNRADAAAIAAGDELGNICASNPTSATTAPELPIGQMGQLFSGPPGSASDLPYPYNGAGSPLAAFPAFNGYQNVPNLTVSNGTNGANYHVLLNANDYAPAGGTNFSIGDFCHGDPTLDKTDRECFGLTSLSGQLALDCAKGAMIDVKVTQSNLPLFFPLLGLHPDISAHSRVAAQGIGSSNNLKPLGVRDPGVVPCIKVNVIPFGGTGTPPATQTVQLAVNNGLTGSTGPVFWDNSSHNGGTGDAIGIPSGWNLYVQTVLYAQGASGTCSTVSNPLTYEASSGILDLNSYGTTSPTSTQAPGIVGQTSASGLCATEACGVTVINQAAPNTCQATQYFSTNAGNCTVRVCAIVAFTPGSTNHDVTLATPLVGNGNARDMHTGAAIADPTLCKTTRSGTEAWESDAVTVPTASGQGQFTLAWKEDSGTLGSAFCNGGGHCAETFGVQQQTFSACNENFNTACVAPNQSGPIIGANVLEGAASTLGSFQAGTTHNLVFRLAIQGLQDSPRTDRCAAGITQCTLLRVDQGNADGMVNCGQGDGTGGGGGNRAVMLYGCPLYGQEATAANPVACDTNPKNSKYCGGWMVTPDGSCNNATRTPTSSVDCVNTNNGGATIPACLQALVVAGANGPVDYSQIDNNCHVSGTQCSEDKWLDGGSIDPTSGVPDPRIITAFILFQGDIQGVTGQHDLPIRTFASFYVTGWQVKSNGQQVDCGTPPPLNQPPPAFTRANEPPPSNLPSNADAIWGHWITYTEIGAGGNGQACNFQAFGDCAVVLTR
jgi:hypothetical protein